MHVTARIFLLGMIDICMHIALQCPIAAGRVGVEPTAGLDGEVCGLLHGLHGEIAGRLDDNSPLAAHPRDDRRPVFVVMTTARLALLAAPTRPAPQGLCPSLFGL